MDNNKCKAVEAKPWFLYVGLGIFFISFVVGTCFVLHLEDKVSLLSQRIDHLNEKLISKDLLLKEAAHVLTNLKADSKSKGDPLRATKLLKRATRDVGGFQDELFMNRFSNGGVMKVVNSLRREMYSLSDRVRYYMRYGGRSQRSLPGPPGPPGKAGDRGPPGMPGRAGNMGERGFPGINGARGPPGKPGESGKDGISGSNGVPGYPGYPGERGEKGDRGYTGLPGNDGYPGQRGPPGDLGHRGEKGLKGEKGDTEIPKWQYIYNRLNEQKEEENYELPGYYRGGGGGSVSYVRWGSSSCPLSSSFLVYSGQTVTSKFYTKENTIGSNVMCLPTYFPPMRKRSKREAGNNGTEPGSGEREEGEHFPEVSLQDIVRTEEKEQTASGAFRAMPSGPPKKDFFAKFESEVSGEGENMQAQSTVSPTISARGDETEKHGSGESEQSGSGVRYSTTKSSVKRQTPLSSSNHFEYEDIEEPTEDMKMVKRRLILTDSYFALGRAPPPPIEPTNPMTTKSETNNMTSSTPSVVPTKDQPTKSSNKMDENKGSQEKNANSIDEPEDGKVEEQASYLWGTRKYIPCSVCRVVARSTQIMIPSRTSCPSGWTKEYHGYLMAFHHKTGQSELLCADKDALGVAPGSDPHIRRLLSQFMTNVRVDCATLSCPPLNYVDVQMCTVCTI